MVGILLGSPLEHKLVLRLLDLHSVSILGGGCDHVLHLNGLWQERASALRTLTRPITEIGRVFMFGGRRLERHFQIGYGCLPGTCSQVLVQALGGELEFPHSVQSQACFRPATWRQGGEVVLLAVHAKMEVEVVGMGRRLEHALGWHHPEMLRRHIVEVMVAVGILHSLDLLVYGRDHVLHVDSDGANLGVAVDHGFHDRAVLSLNEDPIVADASAERRRPMARSPASKKRSVGLTVLKNAVKQAGGLLEV